MKKIVKCLMIIIGTIIGAGFASGQEVSSFFNRFSDWGMVGIVVSSFLMGLIVFLALKVANKYDIYEYKDLINNNKICLILIKGFTFICFCIMIAGIGVYVNEQYSVNHWIGTIIASTICFLIFLFKFKGLEKVNLYLVPIIMIGVILISNITTVNTAQTLESTYNIMPNSLLSNWLISAVLYATYNTIVLIPIVLEFRKLKLDKKEIVLLGVISTLTICIMALLVFISINRYYPDIISQEMPMLFIAKQSGSFAKIYYNVALLFAIFTTAFATGYAFLKLCDEKNYFRNCITICILSVFLARFGFSNMINLFFPIFGWLGIIHIIYIVSLKHKK